MSIQRESGDPSLIDVLDRVLDKGIVIDSCVRVSLVGVDLVVEARVPIHIRAVWQDRTDSPMPGPASTLEATRRRPRTPDGQGATVAPMIRASYAFLG